MIPHPGQMLIPPWLFCCRRPSFSKMADPDNESSIQQLLVNTTAPMSQEAKEKAKTESAADKAAGVPCVAWRRPRAGTPVR